MVSEVAARISLFLMASRPIRPGVKKAGVSPDMSMLTSRLGQMTILDRRPTTDGFAVVGEDQRVLGVQASDLQNRSARNWAAACLLIVLELATPS
jgi:hypothetical protein